MQKGLLILFFYNFFLISACHADYSLILEKIDINLNSTKTTGKGWDAFKNAPDIVLCVVTEDDDQCYLKTGSQSGSFKIHNPLFKGRKYSLCQNSYNCQFELNRSIDKLLGLVILDLDSKNSDLVDTVVLVDSAIDESQLADKIKKMQERLKNISYKYSQVFSKAEERRRKRKNPVCKVSKATSTICTLQQSKITIN